MSDTPEPQAVAPEPSPTAYGVTLGDSRGQRVLHPSRDQYLKTVRALLDDTFVMCADLTAVDYLSFPGRSMPDGIAAERFELVVNLLSLERRERIRVRVQVPEADATIPTLILMPEDWDGHPLRKDYDQGRIPVQFSADFPAREQA